MATLEIQEVVARQAQSISGGLPIVVSPVTLEDRDGSAFADAWTIGSLVRLASAGVASITFGHRADVLARATTLVGRQLRSVALSDPRRLAVLAVEHTVLLANLTPTDQVVRLAPGTRLELGPYEVRVVEDDAASS
jgi:hypothetical protein